MPITLGATSTLATGVNLPAHLVIIKCTQQYGPGGYSEYSELDILQMMGRAGRPQVRVLSSSHRFASLDSSPPPPPFQFDDSGTAVIMTSDETRKKYENLISGRETVESSLHTQLIEHLNAEVVLGTIDSVATAIEWLKSTFLYVRIQSNPAYYKLDGKGTAAQIEKVFEDMCLKDLTALQSQNLIIMDETTKALKPTGTGLAFPDRNPLSDCSAFASWFSEKGASMAKFYIKFETMVKIADISPATTLEELIDVTSNAEEFSEFRFQAGDKSILNGLNNKKAETKVRFPLKGRVASIPMKVNIMMQVNWFMSSSLRVRKFYLLFFLFFFFRPSSAVSRWKIFIWRKRLNEFPLLPCGSLDVSFLFVCLFSVAFLSNAQAPNNVISRSFQAS